MAGTSPGQRAANPFYQAPQESSASVIAEARRRTHVRSIRTNRPYTPAGLSHSPLVPNTAQRSFELPNHTAGLPDEDIELVPHGRLAPLKEPRKRGALQVELHKTLRLEKQATRKRAAVTDVGPTTADSPDFMYSAESALKSNGNARPSLPAVHAREQIALPRPPPGRPPTNVPRRAVRSASARSYRHKTTSAAKRAIPKDVGDDTVPGSVVDPMSEQAPSQDSSNATSTGRAAKTGSASGTSGSAVESSDASVRGVTGTGTSEGESSQTHKETRDELSKVSGKSSFRPTSAYTAGQQRQDYPAIFCPSKLSDTESYWECLTKGLDIIEGERSKNSCDMDYVATVIRDMCVILRAIKNSTTNYTLLNRYRSKTLKPLYDMLRTDHVPTIMGICQLAFEFEVKNKNLKNIFKCLLTVAKGSANLGQFEDEDLLGHLMEVVFAKESDSWEIKTLAAGILKMATLHRNTGIILVKKDILARLFDFFSTCETPVASTGVCRGQPEVEATAAGVMVQATGLFRNLAENLTLQTIFLEERVCNRFYPLLDTWFDHKDVVFNVVRIFSCLTTDPKFQKQLLAGVPGCGEELFQMVRRLFKERENLDGDLMVRLWFVMGNLAEDSEKFRCSMLPNDRAVHKMGKLFSRTVAKVFEEDVQDPKYQERLDDLLVKILRVIINLSLTKGVGVMLACDEDVVTTILRIFRVRHLEKSQKLLEAVLLVTANLSFYACIASHILPKQKEILELLVPHLKSKDLDIAVDAMHILSNMTRSQEMRNLVVEMDLLAVIVQLLAIPNHELVNYVLGALVNIASDSSLRDGMKKSKAVEMLSKVIRFYGPSNWDLAMLSCRVLWNFCQSAESGEEILTPSEADDLMQLLHEQLSLTKYQGGTDVVQHEDTAADTPDEGDYEEELAYSYRNNFLPVADLLLEFILVKIKRLQPVEDA